MGDNGRDRQGNPKPNFEPGMEVLSKITVLGEGPCGTLTGQAVRNLGLNRNSQAQIYAVGVKELWQVGDRVPAGLVCHTMGYPLGKTGYGGGFLYGMGNGQVALGFVAGLDHPDPRLDGHRLLQEFKSHPCIRSKLDGGKLISYGAKTIPEGGLYSMPELIADGLMIIGDSAGFLNAQRLKGIHLAVKSGMLAAETAFEALLNENYSKDQLASYREKFKDSWAYRELKTVRNFRQSFQSGFWTGLAHSAIQFVTHGKGIKDPYPVKPGYTLVEKIEGKEKPELRPIVQDETLVFDKLSDLFHSDTTHEEDQPCHLKISDSSICDEKCGQEYGYPCISFCPASVYEIAEDRETGKLRINFSNCVHCKTCEVADPYQIIRWTVPEGGGGPNWKGM
jgi:electron-transferring-flavoprotein dehydrogenase